MLLEGETSRRLIFRKIIVSDFKAWLPFYNNPLSTKYWNETPKIAKEACGIQFKKIFYRYDNNLGGMNALVCKNTGLLIGMCGLLPQVIDNLPELEIGYSILPQYWGQGYATEAAKKCKLFVIENNLATSIISIIHIDNKASQKVAVSNGMIRSTTTIYKNNPVHIYRITL